MHELAPGYIQQIVRGLSLKKGEKLSEDDSEKEEAKSELTMTNSVKGILDISVYKLYIISKKIKTIHYIKIRITYRKLFRFYIDLKRLYDPPLPDNNLYTAIILND